MTARNVTSVRGRLAAWLLGCGAFSAVPAHAGPVTCSASMTNLAFGSVNPQSSQTDATATLNYTCTNNSNGVVNVAACFGIGVGGFDAASANPRRLQSGVGQYLQFQIYQDAALSQPWGSDSGTVGTQLYVQVQVAAKGSASGTATLYGRLLAGQTAAVPGPYQESLSSNTLNVVKGGSSFPSNCTGGAANGSSFSAFTVTATVSNPCTVTASALNFGTTGGLTSPTPLTTTIAVQCPSGTAYNVGLDAGLNGGGSINARAMAQGVELIGYQLYSNAALSAIWGNTVGTNTVAGTGNGSTQNLIVYGNVPAQATPSPGSYGDTVTVYVYY